MHQLYNISLTLLSIAATPFRVTNQPVMTDPILGVHHKPRTRGGGTPSIILYGGYR